MENAGLNPRHFKRKESLGSRLGERMHKYLDRYLWSGVNSIATKIQEVNIPRHKSRYSDLPPVDISNESFQRLTFKPRKKETKGKSGKSNTASSGREAAIAPSIMELYPLLIISIIQPKNFTRPKISPNPPTYPCITEILIFME